MVGHSEVILGPNFPVVTWTYSGVLGHVPVGAEFLLFFSVLAIPKISNLRSINHPEGFESNPIGGRLLLELPTSHSGTSGPRHWNVGGKLYCGGLPRLIAGGFI